MSDVGVMHAKLFMHEVMHSDRHAIIMIDKEEVHIPAIDSNDWFWYNSQNVTTNTIPQ